MSRWIPCDNPYYLSALRIIAHYEYLHQQLTENQPDTLMPLTASALPTASQDQLRQLQELHRQVNCTNEFLRFAEAQFFEANDEDPAQLPTDNPGARGAVDER
ncbi:hypothetical protein [Rothia sp. ZJ1223]|uniref:hypothetical protein n=1 Tax=Rothia sp. ZJ1223 TaxID=2811098 RepID=UPI00195B4D97|nr:hypothetical protein [Rothia sp. ZJ1223]MBM7051966.1 hypothetical protein [Rothia sp. ZJ1223]